MAAEKNFENKVKTYLKNYGCWFLKYWGGASYTKSGIPDLLVSSDGFFLGIEVKADKQFGQHHVSHNMAANFERIRKEQVR